MPASALNRLKNGVVRLLPHELQERLRRAWYPHVVRRFSLSEWPYGDAVHVLVQPGDTVADVGANIGYISALLSRLVGPGGRVHSFEPVPETHGYLVNNLRKLPLQNFRIHRIAASNTTGEAAMEIPHFEGGPENLYQSHIVTDTDAASHGDRCVTVPTEPLDDVLADEIDHISFAKIDVEGHELSVIQGAARMIASAKPAFLIEVSQDPDDPDTRAGELFRILAQHGYAAIIRVNGTYRARESGERAVDYLFLQPRHARRMQRAGLWANPAMPRQQPDPPGD